MNRKITILLSVLVVAFVFFYVFLERLVPHLIDMDGVKTKIEQSVLDSTGIRADIRQLRLNLTLTEGIEVLFDNNVLYDPKDIEIVNAGEIVINIRYLPLIFSRQTSISRVAFNNIYITVGEKGFLLNMKKEEVPSKTVVLEDTRIEFNNYKILVDRFFDGSNKYVLNGDYLALRHYNSRLPLELRGSGTGFFGPKEPNQRLGRFKLFVHADQKIAQGSQLDWHDLQQFRLQLQDVELPTLSNILQAHGFPLKAQGRVGELAFDYQARPGKTRNFAIYGNTATDTRLALTPYQFDFAPGKLVFQTDLDLNPETRKAWLSNLRLSLANPDFNGHLQGELFLKEPFEQSYVDLRLRTSPLSLSGLNMLPILPLVQRQLFERLEGKFLTDMHLKGTLSDPGIEGQLKWQDIGVLSAQTRTWLARHLNADIQVISSEQFQLRSLTGRIANSNVRASGDVNLKTKRLSARLLANGIDLKQLHDLSQLILPENPWLQKLEVFGQSNINLMAEGRLENPLLQGQAEFRQVRLLDVLRHQPLIDSVTGLIRFGRKNIQIANAKAHLGAGDISVNGWFRRDLSNSDLVLRADRLELGRLENSVQAIMLAMTGKPVAVLNQVDLSGYTAARIALSGPLKKPVYKGFVRLNDVNVAYLPKKNVAMEHLTGLVSLTPQAIRIRQIDGRFRDIPFTLSGSAAPSLQNYNVRLNTPEVAAQRLVQLAVELAPAVGSQLKQVGLHSGTARLALVLSPAYANSLGGMVYLRNLVAVPTMLGQQVRIARLQFDVGRSQVNIPNETIWVGALPLQVRGFVGGTNYDVHVQANNLPVAYFRDNRPMLQKLIPATPLPVLYNTAGSVSMIAHARTSATDAVLQFHHAGASSPALKFPLYNLNGQIALTVGKQFQINSQNLTLSYANSPLKVTVLMPDKRHIRSTALGKLDPLLTNDLFKQLPIPITAALPFQMKVFGTVGTLANTGQGNDLYLTASVNPTGLFAPLASEQPAAIQEDLALQERVITIEPAIRAALHLVGDTLNIQPLQLQLGENNGAQLVGQIQHLFLPEQIRTLLAFMTTPELDLGRSQEVLQKDTTDSLGGQIRSNLVLDASPDYTDLQGTLDFNQVMASYIELQNLTGRILLEGRQATLDIANIQVPGINAGFSTLIPDLDLRPLPLTRFQLAGQQFVLESAMDWVQTILTERLAPMMAQVANPAKANRSPQQPSDLPFEIQNGSLSLAEVVINNILLENFTSAVQLNADQSFRLEDFRTGVAGGQVSGLLAMSPQENKRLLAQVTMDHVQVAALMQMFLNTPSQIFGILSGNLDIATEGETPTEMLANVSGQGDVRIDEGRLPQVAKLENLMMATSALADTLTTGALRNFSFNNFNWDTLLQLATRYRTDYFATLTGTFTLNQGVLQTEDILVDGENLDFRAKGHLRLVDDVADLKIQAQMNRGVSGNLGNLSRAFPYGRMFSWFAPLRVFLGITGIDRKFKLGDAAAVIGTAIGGYELYDIFSGGFKLSVGSVARLSSAISALRLLRFIPPLRYLINRIPGLSYVPGIGPLSDRGITFEADIQGPLTDPSSIRNIRWGTPSSF